MNWQKLLDRLSFPGILLFALGAVICALVPHFDGRKCILYALYAGGLVLALAGTAILLDFIPGM